MKKRDYNCKSCNFLSENPGTLGAHYRKYPSHKPARLNHQPGRPRKALMLAGRPMSAQLANLGGFLDNPAEAIRYIDATAEHHHQVIADAKQTIEDANTKLERLGKFRAIFDVPEVRTE